MFWEINLHGLVATGTILEVAGVAMGLAVLFGWGWLRRATVVAIFASYALTNALAIAEMLGRGGELYLCEPAILLVVAMLAVVGVTGRSRWGGWLALVLALDSALSSGFSVVHTALYAHAWWPPYGRNLAAAMILLVGLLPAEIGRVSAGRVRLLRTGLLTTLLAVPPLAMVLLENPWGNGLALDLSLALIAASLLLAGAILVLRGYTVGVLVTCSGVAANVAFMLSGTPMWCPVEARISPFGLLLIVAAISGPAWRRLRG
jgi:hypothetical protein